jgi:hypothetical protein
MAQHPKEHAQDYGLSRSVADDLEFDEGPPSQGQHGETRTRIAEHTEREAHGAKTRRRIRQVISRQQPG